MSKICADQEIVHDVIAYALAQPQGNDAASLAQKIGRLLGETGCVTRHGPRWLLFTSTSSAQAGRARATVRLAVDVRLFPALLLFPVSRRSTLVFDIRNRQLYRWMVQTVGLLLPITVFLAHEPSVRQSSIWAFGATMTVWMALLHAGTGRSLGNLNAVLEMEFGQLRHQAEQLRELLGRVVEAQEAERRRIAMDLHDWVVQGLAAPAFQLQVAERLLEPSQSDVRSELKIALAQLNSASDELRRIMKGLRPYLLDELGLVGAIQVLAGDWSRTHHITCTFAAEPAAELPKGGPEALAAFRIIQEGLNNVARHSGASEVAITLARSNDRVLIRMQDNGRGLQAEQDRVHFGLMGMQERAVSVHGTFEVFGPPGGGCQIACSIPIRA